MNNNISNQLILLNWNANGIKRQQLSFEYFLYTHNVHIAFITETHLLPTEKFFIHNYKIYRSDRVNSIASGGVAILIKPYIKHYVIQHNNLPSLEILTIIININKINYHFSVAYKPPKFTFPLATFKCIFNNQNKNILLGDLNCKHQVWGCNSTNPNGIKLLNFLTTNNIQLHSPPEPTYYSYNDNIIPDVLDVIITQNFNFPITQSVLSELDSDHLPVLINIYFSFNISSSTFNPLFQKINWNKFRTDIENNINFPHNIKTTDDVDNYLTQFTSTIHNTLHFSSRYIPQIPIPNYKPLPFKIVNLIKTKHTLRRFWQLTRRSDIKSKLNKISRIIRSKIHLFKFTQYQNFLQELHPQSKILWSTIKRLYNEKITIPILKTSSVTTQTDLDKINLLGHHFQNSFLPNPVINTQLYNHIMHYLSLPNYNVPELINFISPSEIHLIIKKLKTRKSTGYDSITNKSLKFLGMKSIAALTNILNSSLRLHYFPQNWKLALIIPICKPQKDPRHPSSYRPISLLSSLSKIFETVLLHRLLKFTSQNNIIQPTQFGFTHQHSTLHQLLRVTEKIEHAFHCKHHSLAIFLDIEKAFDKIWHDGLIYKLRILGTPIYLINIIRNFLSNRTFNIKYNSILSQTFHISAGVPQGSCLSPLLFNIYLSDIPQFIYSDLALFADDTALISSHPNILSAKNKLQTDLNRYSIWANNWRIKINMSKCQAKIFTLCKPIIPPPLTINNTPISWLPSASSVKYLGLHLDTKLNWKTHIKNIIHKTNIKIHKLNSLINKNSSLRIETAKLMYTSIIRPSLTYACPIWSNAAKSNLQKIQVLQNKFLRKILHAPWFIPNSQIHKELKLPTIHDFIRHHSQVFFTNLPSLHHAQQFNLGKTYHFPRRILSKFPKDKFHPP